MRNSNHQHLVIDIGNTNIVLGTFNGNELTHHWRINTQKEVTVDEVIFTLNGLIGKNSSSPINVNHVALASVVPNILYPWSRGLEVFFSKAPLVIQSSQWSFFNLNYSIPQQIGADRLCNILGCQALGIKEAIVVDFGTATTYDIYSENTYWGGVISPGLKSSMMNLVQHASRLADIELYWNQSIIGKSTDDALRNGVLYGNLGQVDYIVSQILKEKPMKDPTIIATGGMANLIGEKTNSIKRIERNLTLIGINHFIQRTNP